MYTKSTGAPKLKKEILRTSTERMGDQVRSNVKNGYISEELARLVRNREREICLMDHKSRILK